MSTHPNETDLALFAGGESGRVSRFFLARHLRSCRACAAKVSHFEALRSSLSGATPPEMDWDALAAEMRANIRLGLEAGECVRSAEAPRRWNPRLTVAFASLAFLLVAGLTMKESIKPAAKTSPAPVLESSSAGLELRDGASSLMLLNRGAEADQTVDAQGGIGARNVENGTVTITNVSIE